MTMTGIAGTFFIAVGAVFLLCGLFKKHEDYAFRVSSQEIFRITSDLQLKFGPGVGPKAVVDAIQEQWKLSEPCAPHKLEKDDVAGSLSLIE